MLCCAWPKRINWVKVVWHYLGRVRLRAKRAANKGPLGMHPLANRLSVREVLCFGSSGGLPPQAGQFVRHRLHLIVGLSAGGRFVFRSLLCRLPRCNFRIRALRFSRSLLLCRLPRRSFSIGPLRFSFSPGDSHLKAGYHIPGIHIV